MTGEISSVTETTAEPGFARETAREISSLVAERAKTASSVSADTNAQVNDKLACFLASSSLVAVILGPDLAIRRFSPEAGKLLNLTDSDIGRPIGDIRLPLKIPHLTDLLRATLAARSPQDKEVQDQGGQWHALRLRPYKTLDGRASGVLMLLTDINVQKRVERELHASEEKYRLLIDGAIGLAIMSLDPGGRVIGWSAAAERLLGYSETEILGKHFSGFFVPEDIKAGRPNRVLEEARRHEIEDEDHQLMHKDGRRIWVSALMTPLFDEGGKLRGYAKVVRDITSRKEAERALIESDRRKDEFLAMLAHELRNPLAPLQSMLDVLKKTKNDIAVTTRCQAVMERQVRTLAHMVDDLLDVSRIRLDKIELRKDLLDLSAIVPLAIETLQPKIKAHRNILKLAISPVPLYVEGDPIRLEQIVVNLLGNAIKYTPQVGEISIVLKKVGLQAVLQVKDNGIGISEEMLPRVFELFAQADISLARQSGGLGIGLSLVRKLVEIHGGTVTAESPGLGRGSVFEVRLPLVPNPQEKISDKIKEAKASTPLPRTPRRVLIIDDNMDAAEAMSILLSFAGHQVFIAHDGSAGVEKAKGALPEAVLLDIGMPGMNGYEVARELRRIPELGKSIIVAVTGYGDDDVQRQLQEAGFDGHLVKPTSAAALERALSLLQPG